MPASDMIPEVTRRGSLDMQVCVPNKWSDEQVKEFADLNNMCGTTSGWQVRKEGHKLLAGDLERQSCKDRKEFVHIMLDA
jgi:hypothetical protein